LRDAWFQLHDQFPKDFKVRVVAQIKHLKRQLPREPRWVPCPKCSCGTRPEILGSPDCDVCHRVRSITPTQLAALRERRSSLGGLPWLSDLDLRD
jgi:hypothetical protein